MVEIVEVEKRKDVKEFINFPLRLYKDCPYFVPPLYGDEKALFKKHTVYDEQAESVYYLAKKDGKTVGRIHGILQRVANEKWGQKRVRFTRFDSIDDQDVANALFSAVEKWAKEKGMEEVVGPLGFSDLEREGLLIEGFDQISTFEEQYNYDYYQKLIENYGFEKEVDWFESKLYAPDVVDERYAKISDAMMKKYDLRFAEAKNSFDFIKKYGEKFFDVLDVTYEHIYQSVPFTPKMKKNLINGFKFIVNMKYTYFIVDKEDDIVAFGIAFPAIGKALQKSKGKLTIPAICKVLKTVKKPKTLDMGLIGVIPKYKGRAISTAILSKLVTVLVNKDVEFAESNLTLETNYNILNQWKAFKTERHKKRRSFVKKI